MQQCGQRFLYDHSNQNGSATTNGTANTSTTEDDASLEPLPDGWERRVDPSGRVYFVNHKNKVSLEIQFNGLFICLQIVFALNLMFNYLLLFSITFFVFVFVSIKIVLTLFFSTINRPLNGKTPELKEKRRRT